MSHRYLSHIYLNRRMLLMLIFGFSSGIPLAVTGTTLAAYLVSNGVGLSTIGLFALTGLPYAGKFLWSPLMDRFSLPFLGRRRGWILATQMALVILIMLLGHFDPRTAPASTAMIAFLIAFFSASQDIALDAYRTEYLQPDERGPGAGVWITGYRLALIVGSAAALILSDHFPWYTVFYLMGLTILPVTIATLLAPDPLTDRMGAYRPRSLTEAVIMPFSELLARRGAVEILLFVILYKLGDVAAAQMTPPYILHHLSFSRTELGVVLKGFGMVATIVGGLMGGALMHYWSLRRALFIFGLLQGLSTVFFIFLDFTGSKLLVLSFVVAFENFTGGMGTTAYMALLMTLCNTRFTATQYAFLSSLMALSRYIFGAPTGFLVAHTGWPWFYTLCGLAALPALVLLLRFHRWQIEVSYGQPITS